MFEALRVVEERLASLVEALDPAGLDGAAARRLVEALAAIERRAAAGKVLAMARVAESGAWAGAGDRSAGQWLARTTGIATGVAIETVAAAELVAALPGTAAALRAGTLSEAQVREIAPAAAADPRAEARLLESAERDDLRGLRQACARAKAAAQADQDRAVIAHRRRSLRTWVRDDTFHLRLEGPVADGAAILAALAPHERAVVRGARRSGQRGKADAYRYDALLRLATDAGATGTARHGAAGAPARATIHVLVDQRALARGHVEGGETCEIPGLGPIPVATARALAADSYLKLLLTDGTDVKAVVHHGRTVPARVRTALEVRDPTCVVPGCSVRDNLEIDHVRGWAVTRRTALTELARLCRWHHHLKTHQGFTLTPALTGWSFAPPEPGAPPPAGSGWRRPVARERSLVGARPP